MLALHAGGLWMTNQSGITLGQRYDSIRMNYRSSESPVSRHVGDVSGVLWLDHGRGLNSDSMSWLLEANGPQISGGSDSFDSHPRAADPIVTT